MSQSDLARKLKRLPSGINQVMTGRKPSNQRWLDQVATVLKLSPSERRKLIRAAAKDRGLDV